jgi:hypothetical protein
LVLIFDSTFNGDNPSASWQLPWTISAIFAMFRQNFSGCRSVEKLPAASTQFKFG